jgi:U4/U6 small nuclear ribonucleoprotein PRP4
MQSSMRERLAQEAVIKEVELKRRMKQTVVPTDDSKVKQMLRQIGEPVTMFGEREVSSRFCARHQTM